MLKRILRILFIFIFIILIVGGVFIGMNYHQDLELSTLKEKYELPNSRFIDINGMPVHYTIEGSGSEVLLLLHGTGSSLHTWDEWTNILKEHYKIVRLDLPAFGLTGPNPRGRYDRLFYTLFLENFVNKIGLEKFHIAGNSFGGFVAWNFTLLNSDRIEKLILLNSSGYPRGTADLPLGFKLAKNQTIGPYIEKVTPRRLVKNTVLSSYENDSIVTSKLVDRYFELLLREGNRKGLIGKMSQIHYDTWQKIKNINHSTLIMWGEKDEIVPSTHAYKFHKDIKNSEFIMYEGVGHLPMEEIPQRSAKDVLEFLRNNVALNSSFTE